MTSPTYRQLILDGMQDLPPEVLAEIADFVYFVRKRTLQPEVLEEELRNILLKAELGQLRRDETAHLEQELDGHDGLPPAAVNTW